MTARARARLAAALAAVVLAVAACSGDDDASPPDSTSRVEGERRVATAWSDEAAAAYAPLVLTARDLPPRARAWVAGERTTEEFTADLAVAEGEVLEVQRKVEALQSFPLDPRVQPLYHWSAELYVEHVRVLQAALGAAPDVRGQLELIARRLRILADRVFDRGQARVEPFLHEPPNPNVIIQLPPEVPDWTADGQAAGPPLDDPPPPPAAEPSLRQEDRPTQPRGAWAAAVEGAGVPAARLLEDAITAAEPIALRDLARRFETLARSLGSEPDPAGRHGRDDAAQVRLALLVYSEAARAGQAGLAPIAGRLDDIADTVWAVPGLTARL